MHYGGMVRLMLIAVVPALATCGGIPTLPRPTCESPSFVYGDADGDGHAPADAVGHPYCQPAGSKQVSAPTGYSLLRDDCDDADPRVFTGQGQWQTTPSNAGGWDFDCDGAVEMQFPDSGGSCRFLLATCTGPRNAWAGPAPGCGQSGQLLLGCDTACQPMIETRTQGCR